MPATTSQSALFCAMRQHGFVRVATSTPLGRPADVSFNRNSIIAEAQKAHAESVDLLVYPELCVSAYAIDDLHLQAAVLDAVEAALEAIRQASETLSTVLLVGAQLRHQNRLFNCAIAITRGRILGVVPKSYLPNYREYYEKRWFAHGRDIVGESISVANNEDIPFGTDLIFEASNFAPLTFHMEVCEDYWAAIPPSSEAALNGAVILANLSASNITIGKADDRHLLSQSQSMRAMAAYIYSAAGPGESTTDVAWDGQGAIYELGEKLAEAERFSLKPQLCIADIDADRIASERMRTGTFADSAEQIKKTGRNWRRVRFNHQPAMEDVGLRRPLPRFPFVPNRQDKLEQDCYEAYNIQVEGLRKRIEATGAQKMIIGISGGLDSTHALIVAATACDRLGLPRTAIMAYTLPGFATGDETKANAWRLMNAIGVTAEEIDIRPAARQMLRDMGHPFADGEAQYDIAFENVQAGLRTDYLFRLANHHSGFVIGTGDLSELALGWCTYGVGDHMSHYGVNAGVPKTLIQYLIRWVARDSGQFSDEANTVLEAILDTEISPELIPADAEGGMQSTEQKIGPYELNDFFLHHIIRYGQKPSKVAFLALRAWQDTSAGEWPAGFPEARKNAYDLAVIRSWLEKFLWRFFTFSQFKRSALPNGPKVLAGGALSPRGDWRAPSDSVATVWLEELKANVPEQ